jgi:protein involved in polysaccharide export with SLBB domain
MNAAVCRAVVMLSTLAVWASTSAVPSAEQGTRTLPWSVVPPRPADTPAEPRVLPAPAPAPPYRLQIGDRMELKFFYMRDLNESVRVRPDGKISLQLVGEVQAAGRTIPELETVLHDQYAPTLMRPDVALVLQDFAPPRVYVGGEVRTPGIIELHGPMTTLQSIMSAGGFTPDAKAETVIVLRYTGEKPPEFVPLNLKASLKTQQIEDIAMQPFDVVYVPKTRIASVADFFNRYVSNIVPLYRNMGLSFWFDLNGNTIELRNP